MARGLDVFATLLASTGERERVFLRISPHDGCLQGLRDLDYLGEVQVISGSLVGGRTCTDCGHRKDAALPEWLGRLKQRILKENDDG